MTQALTPPGTAPTLVGMSEADTFEAIENEVVVDEAAPLVFTDAAARKVSALIAGEGNPKLMLRVFVQGGGCSGLQYGFEFDEQVQDGDTCVENQGVQLLIDPMSVQYLKGTLVDYVETAYAAGFSFSNPQAKSTCGCGSSFSA